MNIFVIDEDPVQAAKDQCNKHVVKMTLESTQLLCSALHLRGTNVNDLPYKVTHKHHPSTLWTAADANNLVWLWTHARALSAEYTKRYGKIHKCESIMAKISHLIPRGNHGLHTPFAQAMPAEWKDSNAVLAYRCFYIAEKSKFAKWYPRAKAPSWWPFDEIEWFKKSSQERSRR